MAVHTAKTVPGISSQAPDARDFIAPDFQALPDSSFTGDAFVMADPLAAAQRSSDPRAVRNFYRSVLTKSVNAAWTRWVLYRNNEMTAFDYSMGYIRSGVFTGFALFNNARRRLTVSAVSSDNELLEAVSVGPGSAVGEYGDLFFSISFKNGASGPVAGTITFDFTNGESTSINISAVVTHELFPFRIDYTKNVTAKWLNSIDVNHISPAALGFLDGQQTIRKRRLSLQVLASGDDVPLIEEFFESIGCDAFWLMDLPRRFDNVSANADSTTLYVECGDLPSFVTAEHAYCVALLPYDGGEPILRTIKSIEASGNGYNITTENAFIVDVSNDDYEVSLGALVTVDSDTVSFVPQTGELWKVSLNLTEQPYETVDGVPKTLVVYRYTFTCTDHLNTSAVYKYTTAPDGEEFTPLDIMHDSLSFGLFSDDNKCTISMKATDSGPFAGWTPLWMGPPVNLTVERLDNVFGSESTSIIFSGECVEMTRQGQLIEAKFKPREITGKIPNFFASVRDNLDQWIEHDIESYKTNTTLQAKDGNRLTVSGLTLSVAQKMEGGYLVYAPAGGLAEVRDILAVSENGGFIDLHINGVISAGSGETISCYQGYDGSAETYVSMFGSMAGFGGHPMITTTNPAVKAIELDSDMGGKK